MLKSRFKTAKVVPIEPFLKPASGRSFYQAQKQATKLIKNDYQLASLLSSYFSSKGHPCPLMAKIRDYHYAEDGSVSVSERSLGSLLGVPSKDLTLLESLVEKAGIRLERYRRWLDL